MSEDLGAPRIRELEAETSRLRKELAVLERKRGELENTRKAMLYMLEDLNRSRADIETAKRQWEQTFDAITDPIFLHDAQGRILRVNRAYAQAAGIPTGECIGKPYWRLFPNTGEPLAACRQAPGAVKEELRVDGATYLARAYTVYDEAGNGIYTICLLRDITERKQAEEALEQAHGQLQSALAGTVLAITTAVEARDPYTAGHQRRVAALSGAIATEMHLDAELVKGIRVGAGIHDIGKIHIPAEILAKPAKLTDIEYALIQTHAQVGYDILKDIEFPWPVADIAHQHHERIDGSGYPRGLKDGEIRLEARIVAVADVVEAMSSHRPYRPGLGIGAALNEIGTGTGSRYDPDAADACMRLFNDQGFRFDPS